MGPKHDNGSIPGRVLVTRRVKHPVGPGDRRWKCCGLLMMKVKDGWLCWRCGHMEVRTMRGKPRNQVNCLRICHNGDHKYLVRTLAKPHQELYEAPSHKKAYSWAHNNRDYTQRTPCWTEEELDYLAENYGRIPREQICRHLRRSANALKIAALRKRSHGREHLNQRSNIYTARATASVLGIT